MNCRYDRKHRSLIDSALAGLKAIHSRLCFRTFYRMAKMKSYESDHIESDRKDTEQYKANRACGSTLD